MINLNAIGFVAVLGVVGLGVDYHQQGQRAGMSLGQMGVSGYIGTVTGRYAQAQQARADSADADARKKRQRAGARPYLPEAPQGWTRRAWLDGDNAQIAAIPKALSLAQQEAMDVSPMLAQMARKSALKAEQRIDAQSWVYEHGHDSVVIRAAFTAQGERKTVTSATGWMLGDGEWDFAALSGWAVIGGVAFGEYTPKGPDEARPYREFRAAIGFGDEVRLNVRSTASEATTHAILAGIDYDGINSLLAAPLAHVGQSAPAVPLAEQPNVAEHILNVQHDIARQQRDLGEDWQAAGAAPQAMITMRLAQLGYEVAGALDKQDPAYARTMQELADLSRDAAAKPSEPEKSGGFLKTLGGMFKTRDTTSAGYIAPSPVEVRRLDTGSSRVATCNSQGAFKSCKIGG